MKNVKTMKEEKIIREYIRDTFIKKLLSEEQFPYKEEQVEETTEEEMNYIKETFYKFNDGDVNITQIELPPIEQSQIGVENVGDEKEMESTYSIDFDYNDYSCNISGTFSVKFWLESIFSNVDGKPILKNEVNKDSITIDYFSAKSGDTISIEENTPAFLSTLDMELVKNVKEKIANIVQNNL